MRPTLLRSLSLFLALTLPTEGMPFAQIRQPRPRIDARPACLTTETLSLLASQFHEAGGLNEKPSIAAVDAFHEATAPAAAPARAPWVRLVAAVAGTLASAQAAPVRPLNPLPFVKFDRPALYKDLDAVHCLGMLGIFVSNTSDFFGKWQTGTLTQMDADKFQDLRQFTVSQLQLKPDLWKALEKENGRPFPADLNRRFDDLMNRALPRYLGKRGILLIHEPYDLPSTSNAIAAAHPEIGVGYGVYEIKDRQWRPVPGWDGLSAPRQIISVGKPVFINDNRPLITVQVGYGGIALWDSASVFVENAEKQGTSLWKLFQTKVILDLYRGLTWKEAVRRDRSWDPFEFAENRILTDLAGQPFTEKEAQDWTFEQIVRHEGGHLHDQETKAQLAATKDMREIDQVLLEVGRPSGGQYRRALLMLLVALRTQKEPSYRLANFNLVRLLIEQLERDVRASRGPIQIDPALPIGPRRQVVLQLGSLTDDQLKTAWEGVHQWRLDHPDDRVVTTTYDPMELLNGDGPSTGKSVPTNAAPQAGSSDYTWPAVGVAVVGGITAFIWRRQRVAKAEQAKPLPPPPDVNPAKSKEDKKSSNRRRSKGMTFAEPLTVIATLASAAFAAVPHAAFPTLPMGSLLAVPALAAAFLYLHAKSPRKARSRADAVFHTSA